MKRPSEPAGPPPSPGRRHRPGARPTAHTAEPADQPAQTTPPRPAGPPPDALQRAYLEHADTRGRLKIWVVDGAYIRGHIDEEFTNYGQHYRFNFIPEHELWLDREAHPDERKFFIDHLLTEYRLMSHGVSYDQAIEAADRVERAERRRAGDVRRIAGSDGLPEREKVHVRLWKTLESGVRVWIVNGRLVRSAFDTDFTAGGHDYVYEFVPQGEVWIDDDIVEEERGLVLLHELHERNRMAAGWPYDKAHAESSRLEYACRHHPDELHDKLAAEGWA